MFSFDKLRAWLIATMTVTVIVISAALAEGAGETCRASNVPFSLDLAEGLLAAQEFSFVSGPEGSSPTLLVSNRTRKSINGIAMLVESLNDDGIPAMATPLVAEVQGATLQNLPFAPTTKTLMRVPIAPDGQVRLVGMSQQTVCECPRTARASTVDVTFSDGTQFHRSLSHWRVDAGLRQTKGLQLTTFPVPLPFQAVADVSLDATGHVLKVQAKTEDPRVEHWLQAQLSEWSFYPEIRDGHAVPSTVWLALRIHAVFDKDDPHQFDPIVFSASATPLIGIDVFPKPDPQDTQAVFAGGALLAPAK